MNLQVLHEARQEMCQEGMGGGGNREWIEKYVVCGVEGLGWGSLAENKGESLRPLEFRHGKRPIL